MILFFPYVWIHLIILIELPDTLLVYLGDNLSLPVRAPSVDKDGPRTERVQIFIMAVDPYHRYSNEEE